MIVISSVQGLRWLPLASIVANNSAILLLSICYFSIYNAILRMSRFLLLDLPCPCRVHLQSTSSAQKSLRETINDNSHLEGEGHNLFHCFLMQEPLAR